MRYCRTKPKVSKFQDTLVLTALESFPRMCLGFFRRPLRRRIQHRHDFHAVCAFVSPELSRWTAKKSLNAFTLANCLVPEATSSAFEASNGNPNVHFSELNHFCHLMTGCWQSGHVSPFILMAKPRWDGLLRGDEAAPTTEEGGL